MSFPAFALLIFIGVALAHAADITVTLETANLRLRKDGPIPLEVRFQNATPRLLEGRLELTLLLGDRKAGVHRGADIVLQPGSRTVPLLLPPPAEVHPGDGIAARLRWLGADGVRNLGEQRIGIYAMGGNEVVLAVVRTERRLTDRDHAREASLKIESLRPALDAAGWLSFSTHAAPVAAEAMPAHPTGWCAYDAVFLDGPAFAAANEKQLNGLARWVEAGGSAGLCADRALSERHVAFLNRLGASKRPSISFALDENGVLTRAAPTSGGGDVPILLRPGLGRVFVASDSDSPPKAFDRKEWRAAVAWLWKFRESEQREVARTGRWSKDFTRNNEGWRAPDEFELTAVWSAAAGFNALTPGAPRQMPLSLIALVLGALLVTVGPADWFALGWLRRRRWTWFAFPMACAAFAWWTAHLAGRYLGVEDRSGRVRFVDLGDDGRPLREVRYEMMLPARDRDWTFDLHDGVAVPIPHIVRELTLQPTGIYRGIDGPVAPENSDSISEWPSPGHFILRRTLRQWSPAMVRITSFPEATDGAQPDWNAALAYFGSNADAEKWNPAGAAGGGFTFDIRKRDGSFERYEMSDIPGLSNALVAGDRDEDSFVRWVAFGKDRRILGGLGTAASPLLAGTSDLIHAKEWSRERRVLCAWRRAGGELLIYRRSFPAK